MAARSHELFLILAVLILGGGSLSGQYPKPGEVVDDPEGISGTWAMPVAGGAVEMSIKLNVTVEGEPRQFAGAVERVAFYEIEIHHRTGKELNLDDLNSVTNDSDGVTLRHNRLKIQVFYRKPVFAADLSFHPQKEAWTGFIEIQGFHGPVTLRRPDPVRRPASFEGTWSAPKGAPGGWCLHISSAAGGTTAWLDRFMLSGLLRFPPGVPHWRGARWSYGAIVIRRPAGPSGLDLVFDPFIAMCCSSTFHAKVSADGKSLTGWLEAGQGASEPEVWTRVRGPSCRPDPRPQQEE